MKRLLKSGLCCVVFLLAGCSTVSSVAEKSGAVLSHLNPFSSPASTEVAKQPEPAPVAVSANAAPPEPAPQVTAMVADNKQCTTFCALPVRQPK